MKRDGTAYTLLFAGAVCFVCSALVCGASVLLRERQEINKQLDRQVKVLDVAGLLEDGESPSAARIQELFDQFISQRLVDVQAGSFAFDSGGNLPDPASYDQRKASKKPESSFPVDSNPARVQRVATYAVVYLVLENGKPNKLILPLRGKGLWSTMYAYLALEKDLRTICGITFYEHGETPGLGGEIENPLWQGFWVGRLAFDEEGQARIQVKRGRAGSVEEDPYNVDGLTGATLTCNGVSHMMTFWLGENGFGPFLSKLREQGL